MSELHLEEQDESPQASGVAPQPERRQLTVMFCDLVGSTRMTAELGNEAFSKLLKLHRTQMSAVVKRYGGRVAQYLGDGQMVYFGHPSSHEDDAERAVHAALALIEEVARQNATFEERFQRALSMRIGIHTGTVVIGGLDSEGRPDELAIGLASPVASRVQSKAEPGQVLMTAATLRLVQGLFVTESLGAPELAGVPNRIELHRVVRASEAAQDPISRRGRALTPFVGREDELERLASLWHQAHQGRGTTVAVSGEAGIGKSRLIKAFREQLQDVLPRWLECRASKFHQQTAYYPLTHLLEGAMDLRLVDSQQEKLAIVAEELERAGLRVDEAAPLFAGLLGLPIAERDAPLAAVSAEARRQRTVDALVGWLLAQASRQPTVLVFDDLHWLDPSTLEVVEALATRGSASPLLVLVTYRPEHFTAGWGESTRIEELELGQLTREQRARMVGELTAHSSMTAKVRDHVVDMTDGVPLFVEEFVEAMLESGVPVEAELGRESAVPPTLKDLLTARLDRVGIANKRLAQFAAVLGRSFSLPLLEAAWTEASSVERGVAALVQTGVVTPAREAGEAVYTFRHALLQERAYESVLAGTLEVWHARVAQAIEEYFPERIDTEPEQLAWHAEKGMLFRKAIDYYRIAGEQAARRSASGEAIQHLRNGIRLLDELKEEQERELKAALNDNLKDKLKRDAVDLSQRELLLQLELGNTLVATNGWSSLEAVAAYEKANAASNVVGEPKALFRAIRGLIVFHVGRAELKTARGLIERLEEIAKQENETSWLLMAHEHFGILNYFEGKHQEALEHFEQGIALYDPDRHQHLSAEYGENIGALTRTWMAWTLWTVGKRDRALELSYEAIQIAEASSHSFSIAYAYLWTSLIYVMNREAKPAKGLAERALAIAEAGGFAFIRAAARLIIAWAKMHEPLDVETKAAIANEVNQCVAEVATTGNMANGPMQMAHLAEAYRLAGHSYIALGNIETGLGLSMATGQSQWDSELYRIKGEIVLEQHEGDTEKTKEAESLFRSAIQCADSQGAKPLKMRAALSLARLWADEAPERVRALIEPIYGKFTEGFDSPDLVEAREILGGL